MQLDPFDENKHKPLPLKMEIEINRVEEKFIDKLIRSRYNMVIDNRYHLLFHI